MTTRREREAERERETKSPLANLMNRPLRFESKEIYGKIIHLASERASLNNNSFKLAQTLAKLQKVLIIIWLIEKPNKRV